MVKMDHDGAGSPLGASLLVLHSWDWWSDSRQINLLPLQSSAKRWWWCWGFCTVDPLIEDLSLPGSDCLLLKWTDSAVSSQASK